MSCKTESADEAEAEAAVAAVAAVLETEAVSEQNKNRNKNKTKTNKNSGEGGVLSICSGLCSSNSRGLAVQGSMLSGRHELRVNAGLWQSRVNCIDSAAMLLSRSECDATGC